MRERESRERALEHRGEDRETVGRLGESLERAGQKKTEEEQSRGRAHRGRAHTDEEQTKSRVQKSGGWCRTLEAWQSIGPKGLSLRGGALLEGDMWCGASLSGMGAGRARRP